MFPSPSIQVSGDSYNGKLCFPLYSVALVWECYSILFVLVILWVNAFSRPSDFKFFGSSKQEQLPDCSVVGDDRLGWFILKSGGRDGGVGNLQKN